MHIETDAIVGDGKVRVGWMVPGIEKERERSARIDRSTLKSMQSTAYTAFDAETDQTPERSQIIHLGMDMQPMCHEVGCKITFDVQILTFAKKICRMVELDPDQSKLLEPGTLS